MSNPLLKCLHLFSRINVRSLRVKNYKHVVITYEDLYCTTHKKKDIPTSKLTKKISVRSTRNEYSVSLPKSWTVRSRNASTSISVAYVVLRQAEWIP